MMTKTSEFKNLSEALQERLTQSTEKTAFEFLHDDNKIEKFNYGELHLKALAVAAELRKKCQKGDRVLILCPPSPNFFIAFWGCIYAGVIAVPAPLPLKKGAFSQRLKSIIDNCNPKLYLIDSKIFKLFQLNLINHSLKDIPLIRAVAKKISNLNPLDSQFTLNKNSVLLIDKIKPTSKINHDIHQAEPDDILYLQYTSGSTDTPKGVIITHQNALQNSAIITETFGLNQTTKTLIWIPPYHDMGLISGIVHPIYLGYIVRLMSPLKFIKDPLSWLEQISEFQAYASGGPNFAYDLCSRFYNEERVKNIDLSSWNVAFCGAETIHYHTLKNFSTVFSKHQFKSNSFLPCYGLAESTLYVTGIKNYDVNNAITINHQALMENRISFDNENESSLRLISCGMSPNQEVKIIDENGIELPEKHIGKIVVKRNPSIAKGYWDDQGGNNIFNFRLKNDAQEIYLDTGDLGFIYQGHLYVTGRVKEIIIIHGKNYYPQWIEKAIEESSSLIRKNCIAVFQIPELSKERAIAVLEVYGDKIEDISLLRKLAIKIFRNIYANFELQIDRILFLPKNALMKTTSGKIPRKLIAKQLLADELKPIYIWQNFAGTTSLIATKFDYKHFAACQDSEKQTYLLFFILELIANLLQLSPEEINKNEMIDYYINDSLIQLDLISQIEESLGIDVPITLMEKHNIIDFTKELVKRAKALPIN